MRRGRLTGAWLLAGLCAAGCERTPANSKPPKPPGSDAAPPAARTNGFSEEAQARGLDVRMHVLEGEQGRNFKINLYDHGSGVAVADYDGDGDDDIYLLDQLGANALFRNDGGHFTDVTQTAGVALADRISVAAVFGDADNDGDLDLFVTTTRGGNAYFRNDGGDRFTDATAEAGLAWVGHCETPVFFDADADGDLDLLVTSTAQWTLTTQNPDGQYFEGAKTLYDLADSPIEHHRYYRNDGGGRFADATALSGLAGLGWGGDVGVLDYDDDGDLDVFVCNMFGASTLYRNSGDGRFENVTREVLGDTPWGAVGTRVFDYDGDGRLDLYVSDMHSDMWISPLADPAVVRPGGRWAGPEGQNVELGTQTPEAAAAFRERMHVPTESMLFGNALYRGLGGGKFEEVALRANAETFFPWGIGDADFDLDGDVDVIVPSGMGYPYFYWPNQYLRNRGDGTFEQAARDVGLDPPPGGPETGRIIDGRKVTRSGRCVATGDFDGDGRPDAVLNNFNDRVHLYMNRFPEKNWVAFKLTGTRGHPSALGATVTIRAGGKTQIRQVQASGGYLSQSTATLYFGLGEADTVQSCQIVWPGRHVQDLAEVTPGKVNAVTETR